MRLSHDKIVSITNFKQNGGEEEVEGVVVYPARHHVTPKEQVELACVEIEAELEVRLQELTEMGENKAAERLAQRTRLDLHLLKETGFCQGMENSQKYPL